MNELQSAFRLEDDLIITFNEFDRIMASKSPEFLEQIKIVDTVTLDQDGKIIEEGTVKPSGGKKEYLSHDETVKILAELDEYQKNNPPKPLSLEQMIEESRQSYSEIRMFDYGTGKMSNRQAMADFYGWAIVDKILHEIEYSHEQIFCVRKPGQISKQLWQRIRDIRAGRLPKVERKKIKDQCKHLRAQLEAPACENKDASEPETKPEKKEKPRIEIQKRKRQKGDDYFLTLERGIIRNETYRKLFKGPGVVYEWLWANIVRHQWRDSKAYPIKADYYDKGYLAYCSTYGKIAKECGMSRNTVITYINDFKKAKIVETKWHYPPGKKQAQTVFILGTWKKVNGEIVESYFRDSVFITPKPVKN